MSRKFFVRTFGCQMNEHDSQRITADLRGAGLSLAEDIEDADIVVLNTCCIREHADTKLYGHLGHLKALRDAKPDLQIAVGGCLAQKDRDLILERAPHVNVVFGTHNVGHAMALLDQSRETSSSVIEILEGAAEDESAFPSAMSVREDLPHAAWVTIQVGCDNSCAFCIVPAVRGPEQSRPFGELIAEIEALARTGTSEVTLLGQNVNSYGRDLTTAQRLVSGLDEEAGRGLVGDRWLSSARHARPLFGDLLRSIGEIPGIRRVRFTSPHPKDLRSETIAAMAETDAVCEQLHLPLQSGSDAVLKAMRRGYTADRYLERLAAARAAIDDLAVTSDVIVGFPGESEADFDATLEVVAEAGYDNAYMFIFSPRPGTRAEQMGEQFIAPEVIADRFERLKAVVDRSSALRHHERVGRIEEIVVEGPSRKDPEMLTARTRQGKIVHLPREEALTTGTYAQAFIEGSGGHHLLGRLIEIETRAPFAAVPVPVRSRRLIPVSSH